MIMCVPVFFFMVVSVTDTCNNEYDTNLIDEKGRSSHKMSDNLVPFETTSREKFTEKKRL